MNAERWLVHTGCELPGARTTASDGTVRTAYHRSGSGDGQGAVVHYAVAGAGHQIPETLEGGLIQMIWGFLSVQ